MKYLAIILTLLLSFDLLGQQDMEVNFILTSGETFQGTVKLRASERNGNVFPSDDKDFIKYKDGKDKFEIRKSEIDRITFGSHEYQVLYDSERDYHVIGFYVSQGQKNLFKTYAYGRTMVYGFGMPSQSINKIVKTTYLLVENGSFETLNWKKDPKPMIESCEAYADYHSIIKRWKNSNLEDAFKYFNTNCK